MHRLSILSRRVGLLSICAMLSRRELTHSVCRMKALVFALIRNFEFELAVSPAEITKRAAIVQRPYLRSQMDKGAQLPMLLKPCARN